MKKFNDFMESARLWKVFLAFVPIMSIFIYLIVTILSLTMCLDPLVGLNTIKFSVALGLVFSLLLTLMTYSGRKSQEFWDKARFVEEMIENSNTKASLDILFDVDFQKLRELSQGTPHNSEVHRLYAIIKTKYKYVK